MRRRLSLAWRKKPFRVAASVLSLAAVVVLDLFFVGPIFEPRIDDLSPIPEVVHRGEELWLPRFLEPGSALELEDRLTVLVSLFFEEARLADETRSYLSLLGLSLPPDRTLDIEYTFESGALGSRETEPCRTSLRLEPHDLRDSALSLTMDPEPFPSMPQALPWRLRPAGGELLVHLLEVPVRDLSVDEQVECGRVLRLGDAEYYGIDQLQIVVPAERSFQVLFEIPDGSAVGDAVPITLLARPLAQELVIRSAGGRPDSDRHPALAVRSRGREPAIELTQLAIGRERLTVSYRGRGTATGVRKPEGTQPLDQLKKKGLFLPTLVGSLLAALNLALLNWLKKTLLGAETPDGAGESGVSPSSAGRPLR